MVGSTDSTGSATTAVVAMIGSVALGRLLKRCPQHLRPRDTRRSPRHPTRSAASHAHCERHALRFRQPLRSHPWEDGPFSPCSAFWAPGLLLRHHRPCSSGHAIRVLKPLTVVRQQPAPCSDAIASAASSTSTTEPRPDRANLDTESIFPRAREYQICRVEVKRSSPNAPPSYVAV